MKIDSKEKLIDYVTAMIISLTFQLVITVSLFWLYRWWWGQLILVFMISTDLMCPVLISFTIHDYVKNHRNK